MNNLSNRELLIKIANNDIDARNQLIEKNMALVWSLVNRYQSYNFDKEDLFQFGCLGLIKAIDNFNLNYEVQFSTYAVPIILGEIKKAFREEGSIKVSRGLKELYLRIQEYRMVHQNENIELHIETLAKELNVSQQDIILALESHYYPTSLDETIYEKEDTSIKLQDTIFLEESFSKLDHICLENGVNKLTKKEKTLIYLRYYENINQSEIAKKLGVSQVQVSRLEKKIISKLKKEFV